MMSHVLAAALVLPCLLASTARSQQPSSMPDMPDMPGMTMPSPTTADRQTAPSMQTMPGMTMPPSATGTMESMTGMMAPAGDLRGSVLNHSASGTSIEPPSTPMPMLMTSRGLWMFMLHGNAFLADTQQQAVQPVSPAPRRGADKLFSTNWIMPMAMRRLGPGQLTLRAMFSLEPATITHRYYPELFQQGETASGAPIVDGQHPHDFFMEVAALYDWKTSERTLVSFYAAPVGDPAIGPTAYPHRMSASEDPIAALGHHQQDSTHIAFNVLTAGFTWRWLRFEESGFHGAEPTEARWHFEPSPNGHAIDSYSSRLTFVPSANWSAQYSWAHLTSPESLYPKDAQSRQTASVMVNRPLGRDIGSGQRSANLSATLLWGRTRSLADNSKENSYLAEALLQFASTNYIWTRLENTGRSNELLLPPGSQLPPGFAESPLGHVAAYTAGYDHDLHIAPHLLAAPGAQFTSYTTPGALTGIYGAHPFGVVASVRFRINSK